MVGGRHGRYATDDLIGVQGSEVESLLTEHDGCYLDAHDFDAAAELDEADAAVTEDGDGEVAKDSFADYLTKLRLCRILGPEEEVAYAKAKDAARDAALRVCADAGYPLKDKAGNTPDKPPPNPGKFWKYVDGTKSKLTSKQAAELDRRIHEMNAAEAALVESCLPLVVWWMTEKRHVKFSHLPDYVDAGNNNLYSAVYRFNWKRGFRLSTYASRWIDRGFLRQRKRGCNGTLDLPDYFSQLMRKVSDAISQNKHEGNMDPDIDDVMGLSGGSRSSVKRAMQMSGKGMLHIDSCLGEKVDGASLDIESRDTLPPDEEAMQAERAGLVRQAVGELEPRERFVIERRYGLNGCSTMTLEGIGDQIGLTKEGVRQVQKKVEEKLHTIITGLEREASCLIG